MVLVTQTLAQLKDIYQENWETLIANAGLKLFFCNDDNFTREYVSKSIGEREIVRTVASMSRSEGISASFSQGLSESRSASVSWAGKGFTPNFSDSHTLGRSSSITRGRSQSETLGLSQTIQ